MSRSLTALEFVEIVHRVFMPEEKLILIEAPHFAAGIVARDGKVTVAAPILIYMLGWDGKQVADYCRSKGWTWTRVGA